MGLFSTRSYWRSPVSRLLFYLDSLAAADRLRELGWPELSQLEFINEWKELYGNHPTLPPEDGHS